MNWLAEGFGAVAVILNFIGYRQNKVEKYLYISGLALFCVSTHFFMLGAMAAGIGCLLAGVRNLVATRYRNKGVLYFFILANVGFLVYELAFLHHPWYVLISYTSSLIFTVGSVLLTDAKRIRQWFILAESLGLVYALIVGSIFGSIFNVSNLISIGIKLWQEHKAEQSS